MRMRAKEGRKWEKADERACGKRERGRIKRRKKKNEIKGHFVVRSVNECESDGTIAMRTWFVVFEHVIRQPASSISGHRRGGESGRLPAGQIKREREVGSVAGGRRWLGGAPFEGSLR